MPIYSSVDRILARLGNRPIDGSARPNVSDVGLFIDEAEAEVLGILAIHGIAAPAALANGGLIIAHRVSEYVARLVRWSSAAAAGDSTNPDGQRIREEWEVWLRYLRENPDLVSAEFSGASTSASSLRLSSYVTDNRDGKTSADFAPRVTTEEQW